MSRQTYNVEEIQKMDDDTFYQEVMDWVRISRNEGGLRVRGERAYLQNLFTEKERREKQS